MSLEQLQFLYEQNMTVATVFWEWRHKVMTFSFAVIAALLGLAGWIDSHDLGRIATAAPFLLAGVVAAVCLLFTVRSKEILNHAYRSGAHLENAIAAGTYADAALLVFNQLNRDRESRENPDRESGGEHRQLVEELRPRATFTWGLEFAFLVLTSASWVLGGLVLAGALLGDN
jgi:hypothetical protein